MKWMKASRDGSSDGPLERESIPRYRIWSIGLVGRASCHVRHVFIGPLVCGGAATRQQRYEPQAVKHAEKTVHSSASPSLIRSAPLSSNSVHARRMSNGNSRRRSTSAKVSLVTPSANNNSFLPG